MTPEQAAKAAFISGLGLKANPYEKGTKPHSEFAWRYNREMAKRKKQ